MKILIAEDDRLSRRLLERAIQGWGHDVLAAQDGLEACQLMTGPDAPHIAILDWMMPGMDGVDVCRAVRQAPTPVPPHLILLTSRTGKEDIVIGLEAGADDYLTKPFDREELRARLQVGVRMVQLQIGMAARLRELEEALSRITQLQGLLPMCAWCKSIRNDQNYWQCVEDYLGDCADVRFSHGVCPPCLGKMMGSPPDFKVHSARP